MTVLIQLTKAQSAIVDAEDYMRVSTHKWYPRMMNNPGSSPIYYACDRTGFFLHRFILGATRGQCIDHINGNGLDCRKGNMRFATYTQNLANSRPRTGKKQSRYKGVSLYRRPGYSRWRAEVCLSGKRQVIYKDTELEAARAYNQMAKQAFGEFARLNEV